MAKLVPLVHDGADEVERLLLEAARHDGPPDGSGRAKTLAALKALGPAGAVGGAAVAAGWKWGQAFGWIGGKWIVVGVLAAGAVTTGSVLVGRHPPASVRHASGAGAPAIDVPAVAAARPAGKAPEIAAPAEPAQTATASPRPSFGTSTESRVGISAAAPAGRVDRRLPDPTVAARAVSSGLAIQEASPAAESAPPLGANLAAPTAPSSAESVGVSPTESVAVPPAGSVGVSPAESVASSPAAPAASSAARPRTSLRDETALLESVRASLARSSVGDALASLARYDARFPSGALVDEAAVLRVEALMAAGRRDEARQSAQRFAQSHPRSAYAGRMLTLLRR